MKVFHPIRHPDRAGATSVLGLLAVAAVCLGIAPAFMPESYSPIGNAVSESAAQAVENAWIARLGFMLLGLGVLWLTSLVGDRWHWTARLAHRGYGVCMIGAAVFSHMPWEEVPFIAFEDTLHSIAATGVGISFTVGVFLVFIGRPRADLAARGFDLVAIVTATAISIAMFQLPEIAGLIQRVMFAVGMAWYARQMWVVRTKGDSDRKREASPAPA